MSQSDPGTRWIVALPAKNEELRLPAALAAIDDAASGTSRPVCVLVLANDCDDATVAVANAAADRLRAVSISVRDVRLPLAQRNAGGARRAAVAAARRQFACRPTDRLLTTDADCRLDPFALSAADRAFSLGADLVLARIACAPDPWEPASELGVAWGTPQVLWRHKVRQLVETLRTGQVASSDIHDDYGGAGIAITPVAYDRLGGFAPVPSDEDRMLVSAADDSEMTVDRGSGMVVTALTRRIGRAERGMATAIAHQTAQALSNAPRLVERHDVTLERLLRCPSHANAFAPEVHEWEEADEAITALDEVISGFERSGTA